MSLRHFRFLPLLATVTLLACAPEEVCDHGEELNAEGVCEVHTECGGHGHAHDGACHCDEGYVAEGDTCVAS